MIYYKYTLYYRKLEKRSFIHSSIISLVFLLCQALYLLCRLFLRTQTCIFNFQFESSVYGPDRHFKLNMSYNELRLARQTFSCSLLHLNGNSVLWLLRPKNKQTQTQTKIPHIHPWVLSFSHTLCWICEQALLALLLKCIWLRAPLTTSTTTIQAFCWDHWDGFRINGHPGSTLDPLQP